MKLDEGYYLLVRKNGKEGIYWTAGKSVNEEVAICLMSNNKFSVTHIETGTSLSMETYGTYNKALMAWEKEISKKYEEYKKTELYKHKIKETKDLFEKWLKERKYLNG